MRTNTSAESLDLSKWMDRALEEVKKLKHGLKSRRVHDLRVALRHCGSVGMGLEHLDPSPAWPKLRKATKRLLEGMSEIRDIQVMHSWIAKLGMRRTDGGLRLCESLNENEHHARRSARKELEQFNRKQWRKLMRQLTKRVARIAPGHAAFELITLERWREAWELHLDAMRSRSKTSYHELRVGIKHFRYSVESFLPGRSEEWIKELKQVQDWLGEVHDLDVLAAALVNLRPALSVADRKRWRGIIEARRSQRIAAYRAKIRGPRTLWNNWRAGLPDGRALEQAQIQWLAVWAGFLDPQPGQSRRVVRLAMQLFDRITRVGFPVSLPPKARDLLEAAAILRDVGCVEGGRHHQKISARLIARQIPPPGWTVDQMLVVARIARYHRGGLPASHHKIWEGIPGDYHEGIVFLVAVLRLATVFGSDGENAISNLNISEKEGALRISASGYKGEEPLASNLASARHLLESVLHRPISIESGELY